MVAGSTYLYHTAKGKQEEFQKLFPRSDALYPHIFATKIPWSSGDMEVWPVCRRSPQMGLSNASHWVMDEAEIIEGHMLLAYFTEKRRSYWCLSIPVSHQSHFFIPFHWAIYHLRFPFSLGMKLTKLVRATSMVILVQRCSWLWTWSRIIPSTYVECFLHMKERTLNEKNSFNRAMTPMYPVTFCSCATNSLETISAPLLDWREIIQPSGA